MNMDKTHVTSVESCEASRTPRSMSLLSSVWPFIQQVLTEHPHPRALS